MAKISEYLNTVSEQIRWKQARQPLCRELETHLQEQYADFLSDGMDESAAEAEAVRQMGDPVLLGQELDRIHRPKPQWKLLLLVGLLSLLGAWLRVYTGAGLAKVILYLTIGFCVLVGTYLLDYTTLARHAKAIYWGTILLSILSMFFSPRISGVMYYTRYLTLLYPLVYALFVSTLRGRSWDGLLFALLGGILLLVVAAVVPSLFGLGLFFVCGFCILLVAVRGGWFRVSPRVTIGLLLGAVTVIFLWFTLCYGNTLSMRLSATFHPERDPNGYGFMAMQLRNLCENAPWLQMPGKTASVSLPIDTLPAMLIANVGWLPFLLLCAALLGLLIAAVIGCLRQKNQLGRLIALPIILTLGSQMLLSIPGNLGYITLNVGCPFIDGNLYTVLNLALFGVLLSVFRQETLPHTANRTAAPAQRHIRVENGNLIIPIPRK